MKNHVAVCIILIQLLAAQAIMAVPEYVVVGTSPGRLEKMALDELQFFWEKMQGRPLTVISESQADGKAAIYLGDTALGYNVTGTSPTDYGKEEWEIKSVGDNLVITGGRPAGTLYGVYAFLERLGVRFYTMFYTKIPGKCMELPHFSERKAPAFAGRLIATRFARELIECDAPQETRDAFAKWNLRMRCNGQELHLLPSIYLGDLNNITTVPQFHTLCVYVPIEMFDTHPEYFSMNDAGQRFKPYNSETGGGICMSNPQVVHLVVSNLEKTIAHDRSRLPREEWPAYYDISVLDSCQYICHCPPCKAISQEEGSETGLMIRFMNQVSARVADNYPEIKLRMMVYGPTAKPVFKTRPADNILFQVTDLYSGSDPYKPLNHPLNKEKKEYLEEWNRSVKHLMVWDYGNIGQCYVPPRVETTFDGMVADIRYFQSMKIEAYFMEWERAHLAPQTFIDLGHYLCYQLMLDPTLDAEAEASDYIRDYYGPAAHVVENYFSLIRRGIREDPRRQSTLSASTWSFMTPQFGYEMYRDFREAASTLPHGSIYRTHVEQEMIALLWEVLDKRFAYENEFASHGISMDTLVDECRQYMGEYIRRYPARSTQWLDAMRRESFDRMASPLRVPEQFNGIPEKDLRILVAALDGAPDPATGACIQKDPDSATGEALCSCSPDPTRHGVVKIMPGPGRFITTRFVVENLNAPGQLNSILTNIPKDEQYHWYKMPGKLSLTPQAYFWGQGWSINVPLGKLYMMTADPIADNTWDFYFRLKFTGPAYVPDSSKPNAIWLDLLVLTRPNALK